MPLPFYSVNFLASFHFLNNHQRTGIARNLQSGQTITDGLKRPG